MARTYHPMVKTIASISHIFSDPRRVEAVLSLLKKPDSAATEIPTAQDQDLSTLAKRLQQLEDRGILSSRRDGSRRRYTVARTSCVADLLNAMIRFANRT